jgi:hypothetical protein
VAKACTPRATSRTGKRVSPEDLALNTLRLSAFAGYPHRKGKVNDNRLLTGNRRGKAPAPSKWGRVMLGKPLAAAITLALLFCGATVGLESVGLLFHTGVPDPQQRVEAFVARLEADLSPVDLPTEPVEIPPEVAHDARERDAERPTVAEVADLPEDPEPDAHGGGRLAAAFGSPVPARPETAVQPDEGAASLPDEPQGPAASVPAPLPAVHASSAEPTGEQAAPRVSGARRATPPRGPVGYAAFGWPVLDWLTL